MGQHEEYAQTITAVVDLIEFFRAGHSTSASIVAERYGVSQRTAQRWLQLVPRWVPLERKGWNYRRAE